MLLRLMALVTAVVHMASAQGGPVLRQGESGDQQSVIVTPRTTASLSCESGDMVVRVNFTIPFKGLMYAHRTRNSPCRIHGTGGQYYELRIPLKGCGTWQESPRVFMNNMTIRFHTALELEEDETKTIVCRYPPPLTQTPGGVHVIDPTILASTPTPTRIATAKLSEVEILIIICLLLFLSLLTLGIGIAYFCLRRRDIRVVRKVPAYSSAPPSQLTRLSSSALQPPSSLLSSVLGHTVRIPRAVPYSARGGGASAFSSSPDHHYEVYRSASSSEGSTSGEASETTVSSSSGGDDQLDASKNLLYRKGGQKSIFSIPKAILRKASPKSWRTEAAVHRPQYAGPDRPESGTSVKRLEMEDQTVTTMLGSEHYNEEEPYYESVMRNGFLQRQAQDKVESPKEKLAPPVYAQVDKSRKTLPSILKRDPPPQDVETGMRTGRQFPVPGGGGEGRQVVSDTPEKRLTFEDVSKNTTMTTSVKREVKETRLSAAALERFRKGMGDVVAKVEAGTTTDLPTIQEQPEEIMTASTTPDSLEVQTRPKNILIRDFSDVYLTTTVETESRELTTKVSRDIVEQHAKSPEQKIETKESPVPKDPPLLSWNVVIRQKKLPYTPGSGTDMDASCESNAESTDESVVKPKPLFDVKIRSIPQPKMELQKSDEMVDIPPLEIPETLTKLKEALMPKITTDHASGPDQTSETGGEGSSEPGPKPEEESDKSRPPPWQGGTKDGGSTVSSSDSFRSAETLRERSSSEVLEVAPTLLSQQQRRDSIQSFRPSMLERSTSEIVTSPDDQVRWFGGVVPVLENLPPEFLANMPAVIQGGFFNKQKSLPPDKKGDSV